MSSNFTPEQLREAASRGAAPSPFLLEESPLTKPDPGNSSSKPSSSSFPEFSSSSASLDPFNMDVVDSSSFLGTVANCTNHFSSGSPGHTPFPHRREPEPNSKSILSPLPGFASSSPIIIKSEGVGSPAPFLDLQGPSPPVNTPEESANSLEEAVIKEAQRKEKELKQRRSQEQLLQKFDVLRGSTPERSGIAMPKKRLRDAFDEESTRVNPELMARLEALSRERRVFEDREKR